MAESSAWAISFLDCATSPCRGISLEQEMFWMEVSWGHDGETGGEGGNDSEEEEDLDGGEEEICDEVGEDNAAEIVYLGIDNTYLCHF